jgi:hypothetical protein
VLFTAFEQLLDAKIAGAVASGVYDLGLETLTAASFVVTDRRTFYTHPLSGAETRLLTVAEKRRNRPVTLDEALAFLADGYGKLLINERSGRAAVQVPAPSIMLDDGEIERRIRLVRPMDQHHASVQSMADSHWRDADRSEFVAAWNDELAQLPEFSENILHIVAGLLLPVWKRLPDESTRVYRLQTDDGERIIGRRVSATWAASAAATGAVSMAPEAIHAALISDGAVVELAEGLQLRRAKVMGANRIELVNFTESLRERLRAYGLFSEIISWKLRFFVPADADGVTVLAKLIETYPVERVTERAVA